MGWKGWENFLPGRREAEKGKAKQKYSAQATFVDGHYFPSKREAHRYTENKVRQDNGEIRDLRLQTPFNLNVGEVVIGQYRADFTYIENEAFVVEDVKGFRTPLYNWKKKHFEAQYGIAIRET